MTKSDQNIHHNAVNCTFSSKFSWGECMPPNNLNMCAAIILLFLYENGYFYAKFKTIICCEICGQRGFIKG